LDCVLALLAPRPCIFLRVGVKVPPDPILAILAFVSLCAYSMIGVTVGVLSMRFMGEHRERMDTLAKWKVPMDVKYDDRAPVIMTAMVWPVWLAILTVFGAVYGVIAGPLWLGRHTAQYLAGALNEGVVDAT
jgi:hypothetical protein